MLQHTIWSGYIQIELKGPFGWGGCLHTRGFIGLSGVLL